MTRHERGGTCRSLTDKAARLRSEWERRLAAYRAADDDRIDYLDRQEQAAYDRLVEFVEAHDLNGSEWDPRTLAD